MHEQGSPGVMLQPRMQQIGSLAGPYTTSWLGCSLCFSTIVNIVLPESVLRLPGHAHTDQTGVLLKRGERWPAEKQTNCKREVLRESDSGSLLGLCLGRICLNEPWGVAGGSSSIGHLCFWSASAMHSCGAVIVVTGGDHSELSLRLVLSRL